MSEVPLSRHGVSRGLASLASSVHAPPRHTSPLGPLGFRAPNIGGHRKLFCRKTILSDHIRPPCTEDRGNRLKGLSSIGRMSKAQEAHVSHTHQDKASRLKAHGVPSLRSYELQSRIPQMSNPKHAEVTPNARMSAKLGERDKWVCRGFPLRTEVGQQDNFRCPPVLGAERT